jgi:CRP/FNR family transcriptional regulator, anaerobic regulatory protein
LPNFYRGKLAQVAVGAEYDYTVESATPGTVVAGYPRKHVEIQADSNPQLARELRQITFEGPSRLLEQLMILGRIAAEQKVASFILAMADRLSNSRRPRHATDLAV